jgi:ATP phosphoribosyltransferase
MCSPVNEPQLRIGLPKGRLQSGVLRLLADAGIHITLSERGYRPQVSLPNIAAKLLKPQNIVEMLHHGSRDLGFAGADWVAELGADLVELLDTGLDPVRLVAAAAKEIMVDGELPSRPLTVASEYQRLARMWIERHALRATLVRTYGATEVFPPEDADCIVDNTATGTTLRANGLVVVSELMRSTTRLYANPRVFDDPERRRSMDDLVTVLRSVLEARQRVMIEVNVGPDAFDAVIDMLPCMRRPTVAALHGQSGFAVKAAVPRETLPHLIPQLKGLGATDIVVSGFEQIVL